MEVFRNFKVYVCFASLKEMLLLVIVFLIALNFRFYWPSKVMVFGAGWKA